MFLAISFHGGFSFLKENRNKSCWHASSGRHTWLSVILFNRVSRKRYPCHFSHFKRHRLDNNEQLLSANVRICAEIVSRIFCGERLSGNCELWGTDIAKDKIPDVHILLRNRGYYHIQIFLHKVILFAEDLFSRLSNIKNFWR